MGSKEAFDAHRSIHARVYVGRGGNVFLSMSFFESVINIKANYHAPSTCMFISIYKPYTIKDKSIKLWLSDHLGILLNAA